jgi:hypothetical protein
MRPATELDFRAPEYAKANPADYEVDAQGRVMRKDRHVTAMQQVAKLVGLPAGASCDEVVAAVVAMAATQRA